MDDVKFKEPSSPFRMKIERCMMCSAFILFVSTFIATVFFILIFNLEFSKLVSNFKVAS